MVIPPSKPSMIGPTIKNQYPPGSLWEKKYTTMNVKSLRKFMSVQLLRGGLTD